MHKPGRYEEDSFPVPRVDRARCDGCGLCVRACPMHALAILTGKAVVSHPGACDYHGYCEMICPQGAIARLFKITYGG